MLKENKSSNSINCPKCGADIDVNQILYSQLQEQIKKEFEQKANLQEHKIRAELEKIAKEKIEIKTAQLKINETIEAQLREKLKSEKIEIEKKLRDKLTDENSEVIKNLQSELNQKSSEVKELNKSKAEIEKLKREKDELAEKIALEKEKELSQKLNIEKEKIKNQINSEHELKFREYEKKLADTLTQLNEAQRKAEQGSMQLQGEIQELALQEILQDAFIYDEISEIKKGQRGADILQIVKTLQGGICGKIYYESKRTKAFDNNWLQKLRDDNLEVNADILVLITEAMPEGEKNFIHKDGVWVCSFTQAKPLAMVLRHSLLQVHSQAVTQQGREGKMEQLYSYLTSTEFANHFGAIIEGFRDLQISYQDEKLKMQKLWKEREKQLDKILGNAVSFYGSIKGIAGKSIANIELLEDNKQNNLLN